MTGITATTALWYASRATGVVALVLLTAAAVLGIPVTRQGRLAGLGAACAVAVAAALAWRVAGARHTAPAAHRAALVLAAAQGARGSRDSGDARRLSRAPCCAPCWPAAAPATSPRRSSAPRSPRCSLGWADQGAARACRPSCAAAVTAPGWSQAGPRGWPWAARHCARAGAAPGAGVLAALPAGCGGLHGAGAPAQPGGRAAWRRQV